MKRLVFIFFCVFIVFNVTAQRTLVSDSASIDSVTIDPICNSADSGYIKIDVNIDWNIISWFYSDTTINYNPLTWYSNSDSIYIPNDSAGFYKVTLQHLASPSLTQDIVIHIKAPLFQGNPLNIRTADVSCYGDSSGEIRKLNLFGGEPFPGPVDDIYKFIWSKRDTNTSLYNVIDSVMTDSFKVYVTQGDYKVEMQDYLGCSLIDSVILVDEPDTSIYISFSGVTLPIICSNQMNEFELVVQGGYPATMASFYSYRLLDSMNDTVATGAIPYWSLYSIDSIYPGSYTLMIYDGNGCIKDTNFSINSYQYDYTVTPDTINCENVLQEIQVIGVIQGTLDTIISDWSNGSDTMSVIPGTYNIYVEDTINGCLDTLDYTVHAFSNPQIYSSVSDSNLCFGDSLGAIVIDSIIGVNNYTFYWRYPYTVNTNDTSIYDLFAGEYKLIVMDVVDGFSCPTDTTIFVITEPDQIKSNSTINIPLCYGDTGSILLDPIGGVGALSASWNNGSIDNHLFGILAGDYIVDISDSLGCSVTDTITVYQPDSLTVTLSDSLIDLYCFGDIISVNAMISGGTGPFSYQWSNGDTTVFTVLEAGTYSCTVTDTNGCSAISNHVVITQPDSLQIDSISIISLPTCDTGAVLQVYYSGGTEPIQIFWSTDQNDTTLITTANPLDISVSVTLKDCSGEVTENISLIPYRLETSLNVDTLYPGYANYIEIEDATSDGPWQYEWESNNSNGPSDYISNQHSGPLCEGYYMITTTDLSNGCTYVMYDTVEYYLPDGIVDLEVLMSVYQDSLLWGYPPYTYEWGNGSTDQSAGKLCSEDPSSYKFVEVTDDNGCWVRQDINIDPIELTLDPAELLVECNLENLDVELNVTAIGGTNGENDDLYTYLWSNGTTDNPLNLALNPGTYAVTVTDNIGCTVDTSFTIATMTAECVSNVFTPNGDGINDTWSLEDTFLYSDSEVKIYGRFGKLIFESIGYLDPWDGKTKNGKDVPDGTYFYSIDIGNGFDPIKGNLTIIRGDL